MRHVKYVGPEIPGYRKGMTGLMRPDGRVQLDGAKDMWRAGKNYTDPRCFGWHDLGTEWEYTDGN